MLRLLLGLAIFDSISLRRTSSTEANETLVSDELCPQILKGRHRLLHVRYMVRQRHYQRAHL
jgi:hypothetical protein